MQCYSKPVKWTFKCDVFGLCSVGLRRVRIESLKRMSCDMFHKCKRVHKNTNFVRNGKSNIDHINAALIVEIDTILSAMLTQLRVFPALKTKKRGWFSRVWVWGCDDLRFFFLKVVSVTFRWWRPTTLGAGMLVWTVFLHVFFHCFF